MWGQLAVGTLAGARGESLTDGGGHEAVAVEGHVVVGVLGHLGLLVGQAAQGAGGAGVLLAAALGLHCRGWGVKRDGI